MSISFKKLSLLCILVIVAHVANAEEADARRGDFLDSLASLVTVLFILTLIAERIANFFKLKLSGTRVRRTRKKGIKYFFSFNNTAIKTKNENEEKKREFRILKINIFFAILIALVFRADLFMIINNIQDPAAHIGWDKFSNDWEQFGDTWKAPADWNSWQIVGYKALAILLTILGCILVGLFLSFGSKFWHDLLDMILQIKDYKRTLIQTASNVQSNSFELQSSKDQDAIISAAIRENYQIWKVKYPNINGCDSGLKVKQGTILPVKAIIFYVDEKPGKNSLKTSEQIPETIIYNGMQIPTDVIPKPIAIAQQSINFPGDNFNPARIGTNISRATLNEFGTAGLRVKKQSGSRFDYFLLSCFHVLYNDRLEKGILREKGIIEIDTMTEDKTSSVCIPGFLYCRSTDPTPLIQLSAFVKQGIFSNVMDAALAKLTSPEILDNQTFFFDGLKSAKVNGELATSDLSEGMTVFSYGCVSGRRAGKIRKRSAEKVDVKLHTPTQIFIHTFNEMIQTDSISQSGDSGAPVLSEKGEVVGIIVAGDSLFSYVLPWQFIKNTLFVTL